MIHAYRETYLEKSMAHLGEAFDYAVNDCDIKGEDFLKMFMASQVAKSFEKGEPAYVVGKSGIELVRECVYEATGKKIDSEPNERFFRTPEYWSGWAIAYYQWFSGRKFTEIFKVITFNDLLCMYPTLHEADITKFVDIADEMIRKAMPETNLKRIRTVYGYTQSELAELSGVSLRSIQMYEQRQKDINRASVESIYNIAKVLGCTVEDILER